MKRLFSFFKNRWITSILGLVAVCVLIWFIGPLITVAEWTPLDTAIGRLIAIIVCILIWGLNNLRLQASVKRANAELLSGTFEEPIQQLDHSGSRSEEEVGQLKERFDDALQTLRKATSKKGAAGIYDLPWYIIIGPPGSGKTTALVNSGLKFPLADKYGSAALQGVGGTRNCDWWFTEEAVLLDTAGRYTTQDSDTKVDSAAWFGFLDLLKKYRRRRPINGALVTLSLSDLLLQTEAERHQQINAIKLRLQELTRHLGVRFPIYMVFTKCDLIAGFMEFFDDMGLEERGQVWGVSFPFSKAAEQESPTHQFLNEFDQLIDRLNKRLLNKLYRERDPERRAKIYSFPQQMASLRELLNKFLAEVFAGSRYEDTLLLRGAYFTSGTQEGSPIDRVMGSLSRIFHIGQSAVRPFGGEGRSYFVNRLLHDVIFEEADLVGANQRLETRRLWLQRAAYGGALVITAGMVLAWMTSFTRNEVYLYRFQNALSDYQLQRSESGSAIDSFDALLERLNAAQAVSEVYQPVAEGTPFLMGLGLYQGDNLTAAADEIYQQELNQLLLPSVAFRLEQRINQAENNPDLQYEALKTYLMLGDESRRDSQLIKLWMDIDWQQMYPQQPEIQGQFGRHLAAMLDLGFDSAQLDEAVIRSARQNLGSVPLSELVYGRLKRDYLAADGAGLRLIDASGPSGREVFQRRSGVELDQGITTLHTFDGYHEYFSDQMDSVAQLSSQENWILDADRDALTEPEVTQLEEQLQGLYLADYIRSWDQFLADIQIVPFQSISHASNVLGVITASNSPLRNLLRVTATNTRLENVSLLQTAADRATNSQSGNRLSRLLQNDSAANVVQTDHPEAVVDDHFAELHQLLEQAEDGSSGMDGIYILLTQLSNQFDAMDLGVGSDAFAVATSSDSADNITRLQVEAARQTEPVKSWLGQIAASSRQVVLEAARAQINDRWQTNIMPLCSRAVNDRYPFSKDSTREIALVDFGELFAPEGLFDTFFKQNISPFVEISGTRWNWKSIGGSTIGMSDNVLTQFKNAALIRDVYFQSGGKMPGVSFRLKPTYLDANVRSFDLDLEGQEFRYRHGPTRLMPAQWPLAQGTGQVRMAFEDDSGALLAATIEGPWAWFRLLDRSEIEVVSDDLINVSFSERGRRSTWELHADTVVNPFQVEQISQFRCVSGL